MTAKSFRPPLTRVLISLIALPLIQATFLSTAAWDPSALGMEPDPLAIYRQWARSPSPQLRIQAARSLRGRSGADTRVALLTLLADPHPAVRAAARGELVLRPVAENQALGAGILALRSRTARLEGVRAILARKQDPTPFAADPDPAIRTRALASGRVARKALEAALLARGGATRAFALECLADPKLATPRVRDPAEPVRIAVSRTTARAGDLAVLLKDRSWRVRLAAAQACERLREAATVPALIEALDEKPGRVRTRIARSLVAITQADFGFDKKRWRRWWIHVRENYAPPPIRTRTYEGHTTSMIRFHKIPVVSRRLCFVLDASRSMSKPAPGAKGESRWELVVHDLLAVLDHLPKGSRFNVILFRTGIEAWRKRLVAAAPATRHACRTWIANAQPAGWTNLFDALATALADDDVDTLYLLTDGVPSRGAETTRKTILDEIAYLNRYKLVQINCVQAGGSKGLGKRWRGFLEELAKAYDGVSVRE